MKRAGSRILGTNKDAEVVGRFLEKKFPSGFVSSKEFLEMARPKNSPVHDYFEWDDSIAGERFREHQAGRILSAIITIEEGVETREYVTPMVIESDENKDGHYIRLDIARDSEEIWEMVLERALQEAEQWAQRYQHLKELGPITKAIRKVTMTTGRSANAKEKRSSRKRA